MTIDPYRTPLLTARETARYLKMRENTLNVWLASPADEPAARKSPHQPSVGYRGTSAGTAAPDPVCSSTRTVSRTVATATRPTTTEKTM
jgi:hypothetical protein